MRYPLNIHTFLWLANEPIRIFGNTLDLFGGCSNELLISVANAVELSISGHRGLVAGELVWE